jgi:hypothetical protein
MMTAGDCGLMVMFIMVDQLTATLLSDWLYLHAAIQAHKAMHSSAFVLHKHCKLHACSIYTQAQQKSRRPSSTMTKQANSMLTDNPQHIQTH